MMYECPKCESKDVESYDRFSGGLSMLILSPIVAFISMLLGAPAVLTVIVFIAMVVGGVTGLYLTVSSGRRITTCNKCKNVWRHS